MDRGRTVNKSAQKKSKQQTRGCSDRGSEATVGVIEEDAVRWRKMIGSLELLMLGVVSWWFLRELLQSTPTRLP